MDFFHLNSSLTPVVMECRWWLFDDETVKPSRGDHSGEGAVEKEKAAASVTPAGQQSASSSVVDLSVKQAEAAAVVSAEENGEAEFDKDEEDDPKIMK